MTCRSSSSSGNSSPTCTRIDILSAPATAERVRRLEERGAVRGYAALIDPEAVGCGLTAFIAVTLERLEHRDPFLQRVLELPEIQECHHIAGDDDYLLKVRCRSPRDLEQISSERIKSLQGLARLLCFLQLRKRLLYLYLTRLVSLSQT